MATLINKNPERRVQYKIDANKTEIMFPNFECLSAALLRDLLPSGSTPAGDSAYITDASDLVPVESLKVNIQPVQSGTGDPSPENVRSITGWDAVTVTVTNNKESTDPDYLEQNYIVPLGRIVYSGTLDVTTGTLTVDKGYKLYTGASAENWTYETANTRVNISLPDVSTPGGRVRVISNIGYMGSDSSQSTPGTIFASGTKLYYYPPATITTSADFKAWLADNNLQVVYPLATPQIYNLTPQQVMLLKGINNVSADAGTVEVKYSADIQLYIDGKIAETQALVLEN